MNRGEPRSVSVIFLFFYRSVFTQRHRCHRVEHGEVALVVAASGHFFFFIFLFFFVFYAGVMTQA